MDESLYQVNQQYEPHRVKRKVLHCLPMAYSATTHSPLPGGGWNFRSNSVYFQQKCDKKRKPTPKPEMILHPIGAKWPDLRRSWERHNPVVVQAFNRSSRPLTSQNRGHLLSDEPLYGLYLLTGKRRVFWIQLTALLHSKLSKISKNNPKSHEAKCRLWFSG